MNLNLFKSFSFFLFSLICFACTHNSSTLKVAYLYPSKNRARFVKEGNYMIERLKKLGYKTTMVDADDNEELQLENGYKLLKEGINLLIVAPVNGNTIAPLIREAKNQNIPVIAYNRLINNASYDMFFTGNNIDNGKIFCDAALNKAPSGNYVILAGDRFDKNGIELKQAIDSILAPKVKDGSINIIYESYIERWNKENANFEFEQVIQSHGTNIDAVIACSDPMALGTIEILKKYNMQGSVFVSGQDALLPAVKNIYNGLQSITIYHPHKVLGYSVAEIADKLLKGENANEIANSYTFNGKELIPTTQIKSVAITKENIETELVQKGEYTWDEILN
ncbi:MAG: substrate-binding domain-containing protein [Marinilabiliaceae bacterium]|nr:substrate-binding domain-containing protein [Marinilabiliaceae bacterium]